MIDTRHSASKLLTPLLAVLCLSACERTGETPPAQAPIVESGPSLEQQRLVGDQFWQSGERALRESTKGAMALRDQVNSFLTDSSEEQLNKLRSSWHQAHNTLAAELWHASIRQSNPGLFNDLNERLKQIDLTPIQPGFLDAFDIYSHSGIVNDITLPINAQSIRQQHRMTDDSDVSLGFHAMEYLIFGESGQRPIEQLQAVTQLSEAHRKLGLKLQDLPENRRRTLLKVQSELLVDDLDSLLKSWQQPGGASRARFDNLTANEQRVLIRTACIQFLGRTVLALKDDNVNHLEQQHNRFAGQIFNFYAKTIEGFALSLERTDELRNALLPKARQPQWHASLATAIKILKELDSEVPENTAEKTSQVREQLATTALLLTPNTINISETQE